MSVFKNFENGPRSPWGGRQGSCRPCNGRQDLNVIFFEFAKRSLAGGVWREGGLSPPGDRSHPWATGGLPPYISPGLHSLLIEPKNCTKNSRKKRGEEKKSGETLPNCALVIYR